MCEQKLNGHSLVSDGEVQAAVTDILTQLPRRGDGYWCGISRLVTQRNKVINVGIMLNNVRICLSVSLSDMYKNVLVFSL